MVYSSANRTRRSYEIKNGNFEVEGDRSNSALDAVADVSTLKFRYFKSADLAYNKTDTPDDASWVSSVTGSDLKSITAVKVTATVTRGGLSGTYTTIVRMRNSPKKVG